MTSTITVKAAGKVWEEQCAGHESLEHCVPRALKVAAERMGCPSLQPSAVLVDGVQADWQSGRLAGSKPVTVIADAGETFLNMLKSMGARLSALELGSAEDRAPRMQNLVAQILLHVCGQQRFRTSTTDYFGNMNVAGDARLAQVAELMNLTSQQADAVLMRQNAKLHPGSLQCLEDEVAAVRRLVQLTPDLQRLCPHECLFLAAYEQLKAAFPAQFSG
ncbi:hypothetical protein TSOC_010102 [Tetrabaena socialis]|uniref:Uncharacterized protein n=1 Tax=Tetrabaena socialis TaxID=47790 RepID=A0A2J7ZU57_9CHLO|nr:hypothetical protein TSOC_012470 [Tetrabaena socialis]PNH03807.1 hypothetical protein TSOC_010102 [Tetrabaena socialis]|eukprot:PNH01631.1 hypothetical protein TSOC_012470 [Tetrabaena socialis]